MAKKFTSCVKPENYIDLSGTSTGVLGIIGMILLYGIAAVLVGVFLGGHPVILATIALFAAAITYLEWWLHGRLICLGKDERSCVIIGMVIGNGPSDPKNKAGDDDYTMNILLPISPFDNGVDNPKDDNEHMGLFNYPKTEYWSQPQGYLIAENSSILNIGRGYVQDEGHLKYVKSLHCEFEGSGIHDLLQLLYTLVPLLAMALIFPPIASTILALIAFLIGLIYFLLTWRSDPGAAGSGTPLDVGLDPGEIHVGDIVVVEGEWIYDSLHKGWNEIHPVTSCRIIINRPPQLDDENNDNNEFTWADYTYNDPNSENTFRIDTVDHVNDLKKLLCDAAKGVKKAEEAGNRDNPLYNWQIHPLIDGCSKPVIIN